MLHLIDICYLTCQISLSQTCLWVFVGPGYVSTSLAFMRCSASHPAGPHGRLSPKTVNRASLLAVGGFDTIFSFNSLYPLWQLHRLECVLFEALFYPLYCLFLYWQMRCEVPEVGLSCCLLAVINDVWWRLSHSFHLVDDPSWWCGKRRSSLYPEIVPDIAQKEGLCRSRPVVSLSHCLGCKNLVSYVSLW